LAFVLASGARVIVLFCAFIPRKSSAAKSAVWMQSDFGEPTIVSGLNVKPIAVSLNRVWQRKQGRSSERLSTQESC